MGTGDCKYEVWRSVMNEVQQRRDILFCPCGACTMARRAYNMHIVDNRPKVKERVDVLATKPDTVPDTENVDVS